MSVCGIIQEYNVSNELSLDFSIGDGLKVHLQLQE